MEVNIEEQITRIRDRLTAGQQSDGSWHYCFENSLMTDAYMIVLMKSLGIKKKKLTEELGTRLLSKQTTEGHWKIFNDEEEGNLSATVEAYFALLWSGTAKKADKNMVKARSYILSRGGLDKVHSMTKFMLAVHGQYPWDRFFPVPAEIILLPSYFPVSFMDFSAYARVHMAPLLLLKSEEYIRKSFLPPDFSDLLTEKEADLFFRKNERIFVDSLTKGLEAIAAVPANLRKLSKKAAMDYMLSRIEIDGSLYSYFSSTFYMIFALLSQGYSREHPLIVEAVKALMSYQCKGKGFPHIQNSTSTVWDTALITHALQTSGMDYGTKPIVMANEYLFKQQHYKKGDWALEAPGTIPGGWGFSHSNTINPDVDDTTAALRAVKSEAFQDSKKYAAWEKGVKWALAMQNEDGGWPAFEKNKNKEILSWVPMDGAEDAALDKSCADLTGRTLEFLCKDAGMIWKSKQVKMGIDWLMRHQEKNGSWYGKWGICYIYGTWAALTGLSAAGVRNGEDAIVRAKKWLCQIQNSDGGWGESCRSDKEKRYISLGSSTPSQTAWALDALIAASDFPTKEIRRGMEALLILIQSDDWRTKYPTGSGLPGRFYIHYHSYNYIWPLLTLSNYKNKFIEK
ncbi:squalene--hopene cyclase [Rossellomorea vietnamensis]|uniref:Squalene--hopene cyclase n=2 Tax=Rossellomorea vietnamensis TaxID=218284 RepID=A0A5D4NZY6_9BACI|nr:squalene--hopene cyclase [Rossellomorea vietnamensis]